MRKEAERMPVSRYDNMVRCPFYLRASEKYRSISCEGFQSGSSCRTTFRRKRELERQILRRCADEYESCPVYRAAMEKYEGQGGR